MLTVEPAKRLRMEDLLDNLWLEGGMGGLLATPSILIKSQRGAETAGKMFMQLNIWGQLLMMINFQLGKRSMPFIWLKKKASVYR